MSRNYQIATEFVLTDKFSSSFAKMGRLGQGFEGKIAGILNKADARFTAFGEVTKTAAGVALKSLASMSASAITGGITNSVQKYTEFEDTLTKAGSKFVDLDVTSSDYVDNLQALSNAAQKVGAVTKYTASDAAGALDKMAMAGISSSQAIGMLMGTTNLATAAGIDLTSAVDMATDAMGAFNLTKDKAGNALDEEGIAASMNRIADVVAKTTNMANLDMGMWFETVKMGAPTFTSLGGQIEEFSAMAALLANSGLKGSQAGNEIKNMMLNLSAPAKAGATALNSLGVKVFDSSGQMRSFTDILGQFETALSGVADNEKANLLKDIFGKEQIGAFNVLLAAGSSELNRYTGELENAGGAASLMARAQERSLKGQLAALGSAIEAKQLQFGEAISKSGGFGLLERFVSMVQNLNIDSLIGALSTGMQKISDIIGGTIDYLREYKGFGASLNFQGLTDFFNNLNTESIARGIGETIAQVSSLISYIWSLRNYLIPILKIWAGWQIAMMALVGPMKILGVGWSALNTVIGISRGIMISHAAAVSGTTVAVKAQTVATNGAAIGMKLYGIATKASMIATAVGMKIQSAAAVVASGATTAFTTAMGALNAVFIASPIGWIVLAIVAAVALLAFGIYELIKHWDAVCDSMSRALDWFINIRNAIDGFFAKIREADGLGGVILQFLVRPFEVLWGILRGVIDTFEAFRDGGFLNGIKMLGLAILQFLFTPFQAILDTISLIPGIDIGDKTRAFFESTKAGLLNPEPIADNKAVTNQVPTRTQAAANSYNLDESVSTSRVELLLGKGISASTLGAVAPNVTISRGVR